MAENKHDIRQDVITAPKCPVPVRNKLAKLAAPVRLCGREADYDVLWPQNSGVSKGETEFVHISACGEHASKNVLAKYRHKIHPSFFTNDERSMLYALGIKLEDPFRLPFHIRVWALIKRLLASLHTSPGS